MCDAAVDGAAWQIIEQSMDTGDRSPSAADLQAARAVAKRILGPAAARPADEDPRAVEMLTRTFEDLANTGADEDIRAVAASLYRLEWAADLYATPRNHATERYERRADRLLAEFTVTRRQA